MSRKKHKNSDIVKVQSPTENLPTARHVGTLIATNWQPTPMAEPEIDPDFDRLVPTARTAEVCRYTAASTLYRLSPGGWLLAFWRLCIIGALILLPVIGVLYLAGVGLSTILHPLEQATLTLRQIATHLAAVAALLTGLILAYALAATIFKGLAVITKNALIPTLFAVLFLFLTLAAGVAWLVSQFPLLERAINWFLKTS